MMKIKDHIPAVDGHSLYSYTVDCVPEGGAWLDDDDTRAPACCEGLTLIHPLDQYNDWPTGEDRCLAATGGANDSLGVSARGRRRALPNAAHG